MHKFSYKDYRDTYFRMRNDFGISDYFDPLEYSFFSNDESEEDIIRYKNGIYSIYQKIKTNSHSDAVIKKWFPVLIEIIDELDK